MDFDRVKSGFVNFASAAKASAEATINETHIRLAVTGLSRAGKTVFITSVVQNLLALGHGHNTLPQLASVLTTGGSGRLVGIKILPAGSSLLPQFDFATKFAELTSKNPSWPPRTGDISQISVCIEVDRPQTFFKALGGAAL